MTVKVFIEPQNHSWAEQIATFESQDVYMACLPALELLAGKRGCVITESMVEENEA
jgi:hypothetical protein